MMIKGVKLESGLSNEELAQLFRGHDTFDLMILDNQIDVIDTDQRIVTLRRNPLAIEAGGYLCLEAKDGTRVNLWIAEGLTRLERDVLMNVHATREEKKQIEMEPSKAIANNLRNQLDDYDESCAVFGRFRMVASVEVIPVEDGDRVYYHTEWHCVMTYNGRYATEMETWPEVEGYIHSFMI